MLKNQGGLVKVMQFNVRRFNIVNRYYSKTGFYPFLQKTILRAGLILISLAAVLFLLEFYFVDFNAILNYLVIHYKPWVVLIVFWVSESFLGLVPPEIFIAWCAKLQFPWLMLFTIASLSYLGGCTAYFLGSALRLIPRVNRYMETKASSNINKLQKWGGFFVMAGALLPIPFSIISLMAGVINYKFKYYYLWALFRYPRFIIYAIVIFKVF